MFHRSLGVFGCPGLPQHVVLVSLPVEAITTRDLVKTYGAAIAVAGLDLDVAAGECVALLGPNGAGKTTTVEILEGLRIRSAGSARVLGQDPQDADRAWRARIGVVTQLATDLQFATVGEAVDHFARGYPAPRSRHETLELVGLSEQARQRVATLSGGQRRRLDVALGIVGRPELLFLDEPTTGFDPGARRTFWGVVQALREEHTTIVLTTHYLDEADALADRIVVIARGRKVADTEPRELRSRVARDAVVRWHDDQGVHEFATPSPTAAIARLGAEFDGEIPGLEVSRPSLEEAYLELLGGIA